MRRGSKPWPDQPFDRFENRDDRRFVVEGSSSPDEAVGDHARERRMRPFGLGACFDGHDVQVPHEQDGIERRVRAGPRVQQAVFRDDFPRQAARHVRERVVDPVWTPVNGAGSNVAESWVEIVGNGGRW